MTRPADARLYLAVIAASMIAAVLSFAAIGPRARESAPKKLPEIASWMASHPADFLAAAAITNQALDSGARERFELWREAHAHATALAPRRPYARSAFAKSGLSHWYELPPRDRRDVLRSTEPLLQEEGQFRILAQPLFQLTRDFEFLRRNRPESSLEAIDILSSIAATNGLFPQYRAMRSDAVSERRRELNAIRQTATPNELLALVPPHFDHDDEALVRQVLDELGRRPLDGMPPDPATVDHIVDYALRHGIGPLTGVDSVITTPGAASDVTRARLALVNGDVERASAIQIASNITDPAAWADYYDERAKVARRDGEATLASAYESRAFLGHSARQRWRGLCGEFICMRAQSELAAAQPRAVSVALAPQSPESVPAYVELYLDDTRVAESELPAEAKFDLGTLTTGTHVIGVRVANPFTPQARQRRIRPPAAPL